MVEYVELARQSKPYPYLRVSYRVHVSRETEGIPHADKFNLDIDREGFLEYGALFPASIIVLTEHLIREGDLLVVARGEKAHL
jgi:hypothetical protein